MLYVLWNLPIPAVPELAVLPMLAVLRTLSVPAGPKLAVLPELVGFTLVCLYTYPTLVVEVASHSEPILIRLRFPFPAGSP